MKRGHPGIHWRAGDAGGMEPGLGDTVEHRAAREIPQPLCCIELDGVDNLWRRGTHAHLMHGRYIALVLLQRGDRDHSHLACSVATSAQTSRHASHTAGCSGCSGRRHELREDDHQQLRRSVRKVEGINRMRLPHSAPPVAPTCSPVSVAAEKAA